MNTVRSARSQTVGWLFDAQTNPRTDGGLGQLRAKGGVGRIFAATPLYDLSDPRYCHKRSFMKNEPHDFPPLTCNR